MPNIKDFVRGWFIGDFSPALLRTKDFEVAYMTHAKGDYIAPHYQKTSTELNLVVSGFIRDDITGTVYGPGDMFVFEPLEVTRVSIVEDCAVVCVKTPSSGPEDKVIVDDNIRS